MNEATEKTIIKLFDEGLSFRAIEKQVGVSYETVRQSCFRHGRTRSHVPKVAQTIRFPYPLYQKIVASIPAGKNFSDVVQAVVEAYYQ